MSQRFSVVDLFSGAGGMSCGFHRHPAFEVIAAADAEIGKPSAGALPCNATYAANMGIAPARIDLGRVDPRALRSALGLPAGRKVTVLLVCPPCTGFSRTNPDNHTRDDPRNGLVRRAAEFALALDAEIVVMENARELLRGNHPEHFREFRRTLEHAGYRITAGSHLLTRFGLPQIRERALVVAVRAPLPVRSLDDLWEGFTVAPRATTVRAAFDSLPPDAAQDCPGIADAVVMDRLRAIPHDGGSWVDLLTHSKADHLMTPAMKRLAARGRFGSHPDVYGRMWWNRPAPTVKRECAHIGNGRYAHPSEDRLCSVREMAALQGFPHDFRFTGSLSNQYRQIGDAVPPLVSHQLAHLCVWILTGRRPSPGDAILKKTHLRRSSIVATECLPVPAHA